MSSLPQELRPIVETDIYDSEEWHPRVAVLFGVDRAAESPSSIMFADVRGFKAINDFLGHQVGDEVIEGLKTVSAKTVVYARTRLDINALAGRVGGDEIAFYAGTDNVGIGKLKGHLRRGFRTYFRNFLANPANAELRGRGVDLSIGRATHKRDMSLSDLLHFADRDMYKDKLKQYPTLSREQKLAVHVAQLCLENAGLRLRDLEGLILKVEQDGQVPDIRKGGDAEVMDYLGKLLIADTTLSVAEQLSPTPIS